MTEQRTSVPVPDPSILTTEQLRREIMLLREVVETRFSGMDKAISLLQAFADKSPTTAAVAQSVEALRELMLEKFNGVVTQFSERDVRAEQTSKMSDLAVNAAFAAAKEAVGEQNKSNALSIAKSEAATAKQIDGILVNIATAAKTSDDKFADIKDRLTAMESQKLTIDHSKEISSRTVGLLVAGVVAFVVFMTAVVTVVVFVVKS